MITSKQMTSPVFLYTSIRMVSNCFIGSCVDEEKSMNKIRTVSDNFGQFWAVVDKRLCYNSRVKDDGPGLSFDYELLPTQWFSPVTKQFVLYGMFVTPGRKSLVTWLTHIEPKSCRTMSHDAAQCRKTPKSIPAIM